jgi:spermidine synthase
MKNYIGKNNILNSVYPCTEYLTFGPWIYMVPQYKPTSVLMLGYAGGTVAGLIQKLYDDVPITAVDIKFIEDPYDVNFIEQDAQEYVKTAPEFDSVIVDLFDDGDKEPCKFVLEPEFANNLKRIANYIIIHCTENSDLSAYDNIHNVREIQYNDSRFVYYMNRRVARLPIR